ncbi:hypothetical protein BDQ17DRAFT_451128 [Cyathus striatus]|nr:hypothetical protein BDQ17DRAFT_451128 [Cyathus striatus]
MVDLTAQEAEEISGDINDMEEWLEKLDREIEVEMKDREGWDVKLEELSHKISSLDMQHKETKETIQSLRSQLHMYLSAPPSPPPSPTPDRQSSKSEAQLNYILSECSESVKQMTRAAVMPLVESVRGELESLLMLNKRDVDYELKGRLDTTMRVMDVLHDRIVLGKEGMGHAVQMIQL